VPRTATAPLLGEVAPALAVLVPVPALPAEPAADLVLVPVPDTWDAVLTPRGPPEADPEGVDPLAVATGMLPDAVPDGDEAPESLDVELDAAAPPTLEPTSVGAGSATTLAARVALPQGVGAPPGWVEEGAGSEVPSAPSIVKRDDQAVWSRGTNGDENW
jgi:hypothetical protein